MAGQHWPGLLREKRNVTPSLPKSRARENHRSLGLITKMGGWWDVLASNIYILIFQTAPKSRKTRITEGFHVSLRPTLTQSILYVDVDMDVDNASPSPPSRKCPAHTGDSVRRQAWRWWRALAPSPQGRRRAMVVQVYRPRAGAGDGTWFSRQSHPRRRAKTCRTLARSCPHPDRIRKKFVAMNARRRRKNALPSQALQKLHIY